MGYGSGRTSRFSIEQRSAIVRAYLEGVKTTAIAEQFGCSVTYPGVLAARLGHPKRASSAAVEAMRRGAARRQRGDRRLPQKAIAQDAARRPATITLPKLKCLEPENA